MLDSVVVVSVEDGGFYSDAYTSGSTVNVMLKRGDDFASCDGILIWDAESLDLDEVFDEWVELAVSGEEGYSAMITEENGTFMYSQ